MTALPDVAREACVVALRQRGLRERAGALFTCDLAPDLMRTVGLNSAANRPGGSFEVNPVIGVRDAEVEALVAAASGKEPHAYVPPTVSTPLGYAMPSRSYQAWRFGQQDDEATVQARAAELAEAVTTHGLVWMEQHASRESMLGLLRDGTGAPTPEQNAARLPVVLHLLGESEAAHEVVDQGLRALGERQDLAAQAYRQLAERLSARL